MWVLVIRPCGSGGLSTRSWLVEGDQNLIGSAVRALWVSCMWRIRPQRSAKDASWFLAVLVIERNEHSQLAGQEALIVTTDVSQQPAATPKPQRAPVRFISRSFRTALLPHRYLRRTGSFELELRSGRYGFFDRCCAVVRGLHWALALFGFSLWVCGSVGLPIAMGSPAVRRSPNSWMKVHL